MYSQCLGVDCRFWRMRRVPRLRRHLSGVVPAGDSPSAAPPPRMHGKPPKESSSGSFWSRVFGGGKPSAVAPPQAPPGPPPAEPQPGLVPLPRIKPSPGVKPAPPAAAAAKKARSESAPLPKTQSGWAARRACVSPARRLAARHVAGLRSSRHGARRADAATPCRRSRRVTSQAQWPPRPKPLGSSWR